MSKDKKIDIDELNWMIQKNILNELYVFIKKLNETMYEHIPDHCYISALTVSPFTLETDGMDIKIKFLNRVLWDSSEDPSEKFRSISGLKINIIEEAQQILSSIQTMEINL